MTNTEKILKQIADGLAAQFGENCEIVIHDLHSKDLEHSIIHINNGSISNRKEGDGPSKAVLEALSKKATQGDHLGYLTRTSDGKILKSSSIYIHNEEDNSVEYLLAINYDISGLLIVDQSIRSLIDTEKTENTKAEPDKIVNNVSDLLETLIEQSMKISGKPVALMTKEEKMEAIQFLDNAGAFLIQKSGERVMNHFDISKYTLYSYIDAKNRKSKKIQM